MIETTRVPPHDLNAERSVIGACLIAEVALSKVLEILNAEDFYSEKHRIIFRAMTKLNTESKPVDQVTLRDRLRENKEFENIGGRPYLFQLVESVPTASNAEQYAEIVKGKSKVRALIDAGTRVVEKGFDSPEDPDAFVDEAEQIVYEATERGGRTSAGVDVGDVSLTLMAEMQDRYETGIKKTGLLSGWTDLDNITSGVHDGDLDILAARPAMGKTAFAIQYAKRAARTTNKTVAIFSLEMGKEMLVQRLLSQESGIPLQKIRSESLENDDWTKLTKATNELAATPLWIDDTSGVSVPYIRNRLRRLQQKLEARGGELGMVVIDYLQLMEGSGRFRENKNNEVAEISRALKVMAREFDIPVLALAQLSRGVEHRTDKRPMLSDLRDSGAIEQDADMVKFLYRDEYYNDESDDKGIAEVIVGKHRNGPTGVARLAWLENQAMFGSLART